MSVQRRKFVVGLGGVAALTLPVTAHASADGQAAVFGVKDFGAVGDGVTDDAPAFQAAIRAAEATVPRRVVFVPNGTYRLNMPLIFTQHSVGLVGQEDSGVFLNYYGDEPEAILLTSGGPTRLENFRLSKTGGAGTDGIVFRQADRASTTFRNVIRNVTVRDFTEGNGLTFSGCEQALVDGVSALNCRVGFYSTTNPSGGGGALNNVFQRCRAQSCTSHGWDIDDMHGSTFTGCQALLNGPGASGFPQFLMRGSCRGNLVWALDAENPDGAPGRGYGLTCGGSGHVVNASMYGLDTGIYIASGVGIVVIAGKYSSVSAPVHIGAGSSKITVLDANNNVTDDSGSADNFIVAANGVRFNSPIVASGKVPNSATDSGVTGQYEWDSDYIYLCTAPNQWKRVSLTSW